MMPSLLILELSVVGGTSGVVGGAGDEFFSGAGFAEEANDVVVVGEQGPDPVVQW